MDIEARLAKLTKEREEKSLACGLCKGPATVCVCENGEPFLKCNGGCKFPWQTLKEASKLHVVARHRVEGRFRVRDGGEIPRCPHHQETAMLMMMEKAVDDETKPIVGHLFFVCTNPVKDGGPCILPKKGHWSVVADVRGNSPAAVEKRKNLEELYALDKALRAKKKKEATNAMLNAFSESEKDFLYGKGTFEAASDDDEADE